MRTPTIETERLILRPLTVDDAQNAFERWTTDPEVAKYMMYTAHKSIDETILRIGKLASRICCSNYILINSRFMGI